MHRYSSCESEIQENINQPSARTLQAPRRHEEANHAAASGDEAHSQHTWHPRMKERAALQVQDYLEVVCRKIAPFEGVEVSADVRETMEMLRAPKRPHNS